MKDKNRITEMLAVAELPRADQEKWRRDQRLEEGRMLKEMKDNMWKKWRGKSKTIVKNEIPNDEKKLDDKIREIESRITEYRQECKRAEEKKERKRKLEEHWQMMKWLTKYIEENRYTWEMRRQIQEEEAEMNRIYDEWMAKDAAAQIKELKDKKEIEEDKEEQKQRKKEKARTRRKMWKEWRNAGVGDEEVEGEEASAGEKGEPARYIAGGEQEGDEIAVDEVAGETAGQIEVTAEVGAGGEQEGDEEEKVPADVGAAREKGEPARYIAGGEQEGDEIAVEDTVEEEKGPAEGIAVREYGESKGDERTTEDAAEDKNDDQEQEDLPGEGLGELPELGNPPHKAGVPPARLGGGEPGWGGGV